MPHCYLRGHQRPCHARQRGLHHLTELFLFKPSLIRGLGERTLQEIDSNVKDESCARLIHPTTTTTGEMPINSEQCLEMWLFGVLWTSPLCPAILNGFLSSASGGSAAQSHFLFCALYSQQQTFQFCNIPAILEFFPLWHCRRTDYAVTTQRM